MKRGCFLRTYFSAIILLLASGTVGAATITINFQEAAPEFGPGFYAPYESQGFTFTALSGASYAKITTAPIVPTGKALLIGPYGFSFNISGNYFNLDEFDVAFLSNVAGRVNMIGYRDNLVVTNEFYSNVGLDDDFFETITLGDSWHNLDRVRMTVSNPSLYPGALDNFKIYSPTAVPVPAAVWLFGSALAGLGWQRRKKTG